MPALVASIHVLKQVSTSEDVGGRHKADYDGVAVEAFGLGY